MKFLTSAESEVAVINRFDFVGVWIGDQVDPIKDSGRWSTIDNSGYGIKIHKKNQSLTKKSRVLMR